MSSFVAISINVCRVTFPVLLILKTRDDALRLSDQFPKFPLGQLSTKNANLICQKCAQMMRQVAGAEGRVRREIGALREALESGTL